MLCYVFAQAGLLGDLLFFVVGARRAAGSTLFPYTTLFRSEVSEAQSEDIDVAVAAARRAFDEGEWTKMEAAERSHRSEEHTSELQSRGHLVCRLLLEKKKQVLTTRQGKSAVSDMIDEHRRR